MHLIFERSNGKFKPNCNILALAWMPFYLEKKFRQATLSEFGWLALGNVGKFVGITLTSLVPPPIEIDGRQGRPESTSRKSESSNDLILLDEDNVGLNGLPSDRNEFKKLDDEFEKIRPDKKSMRTNYNLRGHLGEIIIVKWNNLYQKLATVDSKGNVLIWCKIKDKFNIQTPFYNRTRTVADFKWSNDGKTALICYTDSFILVGSSSGQRHWHSMLNLDDYHITCASWTPNDEQLLLGVSNGNIVVIDLPRSELTELVVSQVNIRAMSWSGSTLNSRSLSRGRELDEGSNAQTSSSSSISTDQHSNSIIVNHRRLSRDCSVFARFRLCSQAPSPSRTSSLADNSRSNNIQLIGTDPSYLHGANSRARCNLSTHQPSNMGICLQKDILAVDFANNFIRLYTGGLTEDRKPKPIQVSLESYIMSWSNDGQTLAVAGFNIYTSAPSTSCLRCHYSNVIKFYNRQGDLISEFKMQYSRYPITAFTWAHNDKRIFVATGPRLHCAQVLTGLPSLAQLSLSSLQRHIKLADKIDVLENLLFRRFPFSFDILNWQSFNCPLKIRRTCIENSRDSNCGTEIARCQLQHVNNTNVARLQMHAELSSKLDKLFAQTIRQPYDDQFSPSDIIWHVPKNDQRYYCTLICYSSELVGSSACGHQYRADLMERSLDSQHTSSANSSDQYKIFVLYIEFQGSLIPILKARRIGFLKPEFVIFDPEENPSKDLLSQRQQQKVSDVSRLQEAKGWRQPDNNISFAHLNDLKNYRQVESNCIDLHSSELHFHDYNSANTSKSILGPSRIARKQLTTQNLQTDFELSKRRRCLQQHSSTYNGGNPKLDLAYLLRLDRGEKVPNVTKEALECYRRSVSTARLPRSKVLPETKELARIRSNIWGTKFKIINVGNQMIKQRRVRLGSVEYKASILHLQPRQICLSIKDMSNYCVLCSSHHHSIEARRIARQQPTKDYARGCLFEGLGAPGTNLIDLPIDTAKAPPLPPRVRFLRHNRGGGNEINTREHSDEKVVLVVGDSIKVAPKLDKNQSYKLHPRSLHFSQASDQMLLPSTSYRTRPALEQRNRNNQASYVTHSTSRIPPKRVYNPLEPRASSSLGTHELQDEQDDDILTLSLDQGDQVRIEMRSISPRASTSDAHERRQQAIKPKIDDEFLVANKTLKSIQAITKMIVDLSSHTSDEEGESSPSKLIKIARNTDVSLSPAKQPLLPPDAPVHRPLRRDLRPTSRTLIGSHSATSSPLRRLKKRPSPNYRNETCAAIEGLASIEMPLPPPPPPSVSLGRRFSSSAKRFFDGSLRSLTGVSGYSTSTDVDDSEESEPLVSTRSAVQRLALKHASQSGTPVKLGGRSRSDLGQERIDLAPKQSFDFTNLKSQLIQKLRGSARNWHSNDGAEPDKMPSSCTHKSRSFHQSNGKQASRNVKSLASFSLSSSQSDWSDSSDFTSDDSSGVESSHLSNSKNEKLNPSDVSSRWLSARNLNSVESCRDKSGTSKDKKSCSQIRTDSKGNQMQQVEAMRRVRARRMKRRLKRSICDNLNCCCAKQLKLNNKPPVWNEQSQVYQLDFSGRVTQESAKNLQIDFEGNLALQFGRIDRCTYTLDYKYPFNAIQAMSVALASLTQRLK